jgi:hypothetical protein
MGLRAGTDSPEAKSFASRKQNMRVWIVYIWLRILTTHRLFSAR